MVNSRKMVTSQFYKNRQKKNAVGDSKNAINLQKKTFYI